MNNLKFVFTLLLFSVLLSGCVVEGDPNITKARLEVNPAPEMRGAGENMTTNRQLRFSGGVNAGASKNIDVDGVHNSDFKDIDLDYSIEYGILNGAVEYAIKKKVFLINAGVGLNKGLYTFGSFGLNTSYFELGVSGGLWYNFRDFYCEGTQTTTTLIFFQETDDYANHSSRGASLMLGGYAAMYVGDFSFGVSASVYEADVESSDLSYPPAVYTLYGTVGYRIDKHWAVRAGAVGLQGDGFDRAYWSGVAGVSYTL